MFTKSKISQSMIDAVNKVLEQTKPEPEPVPKTPAEGGRVPWAPATLNEASEKVPTPTGTKVYGSSYGNSAKARRDQTKSAVDTLKGPKDKEMKEAAKPDFLDMDKDGNKKESMKKAIADKGMKEELKGNQDKIDANKNDKIDAQDFAILRSKKKVKEDMHFANKLLETVRKSDVPAYLRKAKGDTPLTVADVKGPKKDSISAPENLAKAKNEEFELDEGTSYNDLAKKWGKTHNLAYRSSTVWPKSTHTEFDNEKEAQSHAKKHGGTVSMVVKGKKTNEEVELTEEQLDEMLNEVLSKDATAGDWIHDFVHSDNPKFAGKSKAERKKMALGAYYGKQNEATEYEPSDAAITTDTLAGRMPGGKMNSFKSYKLRVKPLDKEGEAKPGNDTPKVIQPQDTPARRSHEVKEETIDEVTIAGTPGWKEMKKDVKDKSGAVHTPMSRARDLARTAFKKIKNEVK